VRDHISYTKRRPIASFNYSFRQPPASSCELEIRRNFGYYDKAPASLTVLIPSEVAKER
jgi:hypothetical protein